MKYFLIAVLFFVSSSCYAQGAALAWDAILYAQEGVNPIDGEPNDRLKGTVQIDGWHDVELSLEPGQWIEGDFEFYTYMQITSFPSPVIEVPVKIGTTFSLVYADFDEYLNDMLHRGNGDPDYHVFGKARITCYNPDNTQHWQTGWRTTEVKTAMNPIDRN